MTTSRFAQFSISIVFFGFALCACQEKPEKLHDTLKPSTSHRTIKEKTVIVPPEVSRRWKSVKLAVIDKTRGTENVYVIPIGTKFAVPSSSLIIAVEVFLPAFTMEGSMITASSNELINPGAKVDISDKGETVFHGWLFSNFPNTHAVTHPRYGFSLAGAIPFRK